MIKTVILVVMILAHGEAHPSSQEFKTVKECQAKADQFLKIAQTTEFRKSSEAEGVSAQCIILFKDIGIPVK